MLAVGKDANVAVQFDAPGEGKTPASFQGNLVAGTPGGVDCVLLFDPDAEHVAEVIRCGAPSPCIAASVRVSLLGHFLSPWVSALCRTRVLRRRRS